MVDVLKKNFRSQAMENTVELAREILAMLEAVVPGDRLYMLATALKHDRDSVRIACAKEAGKENG